MICLDDTGGSSPMYRAGDLSSNPALPDPVNCLSGASGSSLACWAVDLSSNSGLGKNFSQVNILPYRLKIFVFVFPFKRNKTNWSLNLNISYSTILINHCLINMGNKFNLKINL